MTGQVCTRVRISVIIVMLMIVPATERCRADGDGPAASRATAVSRFVQALPLPAEQITDAATAVYRISARPPQREDEPTPPPQTRQLVADASTPALDVLHQFGHHVLYQLLPEAVRPLYWHPRQCTDIRGILLNSDALQPGPSGAMPTAAAMGAVSYSVPEDDFAETAAYFFVICFARYQAAQGMPVDGETASVYGAAMSATQPGMPPANAVVGNLATLCGLYSQLLNSDPARAYADFYESIVANRNRSAGLPMPARTMAQWLLARGLYGGLPGVILGVLPTGITTSAPHVPRLVSYRPAQMLDTTVNQAGGPAREIGLNPGDCLRTGATLGLLELASPTSALLGSDVRCQIRGAAEIAIDQGQLFVDGPAVIVTPVCTVTTGPGGTAISVNMVGETTAGVASGAASVKPKQAGQIAVAAGQTLTVMADGSTLGPSRADPLQVAYLLPLGGADIAVGPPPGASTQPSTQTPPPATTDGQADAPPTTVTASALADASQSDLWKIHNTDLLPEVVLCTGVDGDNTPKGVSTVFAPDVGCVSLFLSLDLGSKERQVRVRWARGEKTLSGRIIRANGKRRILNSLRCSSGTTFPTGEYRVEIAIDDKPAADLTFFIQG